MHILPDLDLWALYDEIRKAPAGDANTYAICFTTNGVTWQSPQGPRCVMGRGVAKQANDRFRDLDLQLGQRLVAERQKGSPFFNGNIPFVFPVPGLPLSLVSLPTKHGWVKVTEENQEYILPQYAVEGEIGSRLPGWKFQSDPALVLNSCRALAELADIHKWSRVLLTRPGCGNGGLDWETKVKPLIESTLDNRFVVVGK